MIAETIAKLFLGLLAVVVSEVKTRKGKTVGSLTPSELTSIMILLLCAFEL